MRLRLLLSLLCAVICLSVDTTISHADTLSSTVATSAINFMDTTVTNDAGTLGPFSNGIWTSPNMVCWACNQGGPAAAAATLWRLTGQTRTDLLTEAEQTINTAIATRQNADGSFSAPAGWPDGQPAPVRTMFFGVDFAQAYLQLQPALDEATKVQWRTSLANAANYVMSKSGGGAETWYTNGNLNLGYAEMLYLTWRVTGKADYALGYQKAWAFLMSPPQGQWPGAGLNITVAPTAADGSDGAGYLAEIGPTATGYDPEYTMLQVDEACGLYVFSQDPNALRLCNLLINQEDTRVNATTGLLDTSAGTRHPQSPRSVPFITDAYAILGLLGGRSDLQSRIIPEMSYVQSTFTQSYNLYNEVYRRALGNDLTVVALAAAQANGTYNPTVPSLPRATTPPAPATPARTSTTQIPRTTTAPLSRTTTTPIPRPTTTSQQPVSHGRTGV